jgi:hypothetical protein
VAKGTPFERFGLRAILWTSLLKPEFGIFLEITKSRWHEKGELRSPHQAVAVVSGSHQIPPEVSVAIVPASLRGLESLYAMRITVR